MGNLTRLLLDTSVLIWLASEPTRLSKNATTALNDSNNDLFLSHASVWEVCLKSSVGKLTLPEEPDRWLANQITAWGLSELTIDFPSLTATVRLPNHHRDPFDRLFVSQANIHSLSLVSPDPWIAKYDPNDLVTIRHRE